MKRTPLPRENRHMLFTVSMAAFMVALDFNIINIALPTISKQFGVNLSMVSWALLAYIMTMTSILPLAGKLADIIDEKKLLFICFIIFALGSLFCGLAPNIYLLITFRVFQGIGAPILLLIGGAIITRSVPEEHKSRTFGFFASILGFGLCLGPAVGGFITEYLGWRYIFFLNIPFCIIGIISIRRLHCTISAIEDVIRRKIDYPGTILIALSLLTLVYGLNMGREHSWGSPIVLVCLAIAAISLVYFIRRELSIRNPVFDVRLFKIRNFCAGNFGFLVLWIVLGGASFLWPFYLERDRMLSTSSTGYMITIQSVMMVVSSLNSGRFADYLKPKKICFIGAFLMMVSMLIFSFMGNRTPLWFIGIGMALNGFGLGCFFSTNMGIIMKSVPAGSEGEGAATLTTVRVLAAMLGIVIFETVFSELYPNITGHAANACIDFSAMSFAFHVVFLMGAAFAVAGMIISGAGIKGEK